MKAFKQLAACTTVALALGALAPSTTASADGRTSCFKYRDSERSFARKINTARSRAGVGSLHLDKQLSRVARKHTFEMENRNSLYHTPSSALRQRVTRWTMLGENVGLGNNVGSLHKAFMDSPAHKANVLLSSFRHVGLGVRESNGRMWVTVIFEAKSDPGTTLRLCN